AQLGPGGVLLSWALVIGANAALFTALRPASVRSLPLPDPGRLVTISTYPAGQPQQRDRARLSEYFAWRDQAKTFTAIGTMLQWSSTLGAMRDGEPAERINGWRVSASAFRAFGVSPQLGRFFTPDEDIVGAAEDVVVISDPLWRTHFAADRDGIGKTS